MAGNNQPTYDFPRPNSVTVPVGQGRSVKVPEIASTNAIILRMQQDINTLSGRSNLNKAQGPQDMAGYTVKNAVNSPSPSPGELVTYGLLQQLASPAAIRKEISIAGQTQLNVQGLHGLLADPQTPVLSTSTSTSAKFVVHTVDGTFVGQMQYITGALQYWNGTAWLDITTPGALYFGTRANTPVQPQISGITYFQTDFGWEYYSNGANWLFEAGICVGNNATRAAVTPGTGIGNFVGNNAGNNFAVSDILTAVAGNNNATFQVSSISGPLTVGPILTLAPQTAGTNYAVAGNIALSGGSGNNATIDILSLSDDGAMFVTNDTKRLWTIIAGAWIDITPGNNGTVTKVGMIGDGTVFNSTVTGSPITTAGNLQPALLAQPPNTAFMGPTSGANATPTFRTLNANDVPSINLSGATGNIGGSALILGQSATGNATISGATAAVAAGAVLAASPTNQNAPGTGFLLGPPYLSGANTVTVTVYCLVAGTPSNSTYSVKVIK